MNFGPSANLVPRAPVFEIDWPAVERAFPWVEALSACPQDAIHHVEGDVWTHTKMVCECMAALPSWRAAPPEDRVALFLAALLHDVAKPERTRVDDAGRISAPGHAAAGEIVARRWLWESGADPLARERVAQLVRDHGVPLVALYREDPRRLAIAVSCRAGCEAVALLAEADVRGRTCADAGSLLDRVELFRELAAEHSCLSGPFAFSSDHARAEYFATPGRDPFYAAFDQTWGEVVVLSGLPGSGKSTFVERSLPELPRISLDEIREAEGLSPEGSQSEVARLAHEQAKVYLRAKQPFVWDATNLSRELRGSVLGVVRSYGARVRIHCAEVEARVLRTRLAQRERYVPPAALERMLHRWQTPDLTEAERVTGLGT